MISYPLYLWHWPLLAFTQIIDGGEAIAVVRAVAVLVSALLAFLTFRYIEKPFRGSARARRSNFKVVGLIVVMSAFGVLGLTTVAQDGFPSRSANNIGIASFGELDSEPYFRYLAAHFYPCEPRDIRENALIFENTRRCFQSKHDGFPDVVLLGDSHAEDLLTGISEQLPNLNVAAYIKGDGFPIPSYEDFRPLLNFLSEDQHAKTVIVAAAWTTRYRLKQIESVDELTKQISSTVKILLNVKKKVFLVDDRPLFSFWPSRCKYGRFWAPWWAQTKCTMSSAEFVKQQSQFSTMLLDVQSRWPQVEILKAGSAFCDNSICSMAGDGELYYRDADHLTIGGSRHLGQILFRQSKDLRDLRHDEGSATP